MKEETNGDESDGSVRAKEGELHTCVSRETAEAFGARWSVDVADTADLSGLYAAQSKDSNYEGLWLLKKNKKTIHKQGP